jgi:hypothetical protein
MLAPSHVLPVAALALAQLAPVSAAATSVTLSFSGTFDEVSDEEGISDGSVTGGTPFSALVTFDDSATDLDSSPNEGVYGFATPPWSMVVVFGSYTLATSDQFLINVIDDVAAEDVVILASGVSVAGPLQTEFEDADLEIDLFDSSASALNSDALASVPFDLDSWPDARLFFTIRTADTEFDFSGSGPVESLVLLPEPSLALLSLGGLVLALRQRRR